MAKEAVIQRGVSICVACKAFMISETCYRYQPTLSDGNVEIADWLIRLTHNQRNWGFGLCFLFLRNVKGFGWNHKRVYRIYCELELNLRIKPRNGWCARRRNRCRFPRRSTRCGRWTSCMTGYRMAVRFGCSM